MPRFLMLNHAILFACCSIYLGTGISTLLFHVPVQDRLTPDTYQLVFVEPIARATIFFTRMTMLMLITGAIMLVTEWFSGLRWVPLVVLAANIAASLVTVYLIFPINNALTAGIADQAELSAALADWTWWSWLRMGLWTVEWAAMMIWFCAVALKGRADQ